MQDGDGFVKENTFRTYQLLTFDSLAIHGLEGGNLKDKEIKKSDSQVVT